VRWSRPGAGGLSTHQEHAVDADEDRLDAKRIIEIATDDFDTMRKSDCLRTTRHRSYVLAARDQLPDHLTTDISSGARDQNHRSTSLITSCGSPAAGPECQM